MYREKKGGKHGRGGEIRVLVLVPTRELAVQCADVGRSLARFTDITFGVIVGTFSLSFNLMICGYYYTSFSHLFS